jgi:hypothetical protein
MTGSDSEADVVKSIINRIKKLQRIVGDVVTRMI